VRNVRPSPADCGGMTSKRLRTILDELEDPTEFVFAAPLGELEETGDVLFTGWRLAARDADAAYGEWRRRRDCDSYARYRACADRADAAQDALAVRPPV
jgi:hypothetical protein